MIREQSFGSVGGREVRLYTMENGSGLRASVMDFGATMVSLCVPDRQGKVEDVLLGHDNLDGYVKNNRYFGCVVGRFANRIAGGRFRLEDRDYTLAVNNGSNALHGGLQGFDKKVWHAEPFEGRDGAGVRLGCLSVDMEEGYPGDLVANVVYTLTERNELVIEYSAMTDRTTICNLTNHSYFNLSGDAKTDILGHLLAIDADCVTPVDREMIPTGELRRVAGTPMDFTRPTEIGRRIDAVDDQLEIGNGYDHNWVIKNRREGCLTHAVKLMDPASGRAMDVLTTEPGVQVYTGNFLDGSVTGKKGVAYRAHFGVCLETQHYPDAPNHPSFPTTTLHPGETLRSATTLRFSMAGKNGRR